MTGKTRDNRKKQRTLQVEHIRVSTHQLRVVRNVQRFESAAPLLIFNGLGLNVETLFPLLRMLKEEAIAFDVPGVGESSTPVFPLRFVDIARLSTKVLDHYGVSEVTAMGISWGSGIAQEFAYHHAERCTGLIIASGSTGMVTFPRDISALMELSSPRRCFDHEHLRRIAGELYGGKFARDDALLDEYLDVVIHHRTPTTYYAQLYASFGWTSLLWLHRIKQPTLILVGRDDRMLSSANAWLMHSRLPCSEVVELDDGHMFFYSSPEETARLVTDFLAHTR